MEFDAQKMFKTADKMLFLAAQNEGTAERLGHHDFAHIIFKRAVEFQQELVKAIEQMLITGAIRPAFSILRTSLELTTSFSWLADDFDNRLERYLEGKCPGAQKMMSNANLGWEEEYRKTYAQLSDFVHGSFALSDFNKVVRECNQDGSELYSALDDYFIIESKGNREVRVVKDLSEQELVAMHGGYIAAKTFDSALTMLIRASGDYSDSHHWWPGRDSIERFDQLVRDNWTNMNFLWLTEKNRLAICRVEGRYL